MNEAVLPLEKEAPPLPPLPEGPDVEEALGGLTTRVGVGEGDSDGEAAAGDGGSVGEGDGVFETAEQSAEPSGAAVPAGQGRHAAALVAAPAAKVFTGQGVHTLEAPYQP